MAAKLVRDMVKSLEAAASDETAAERQAVLLATKDLILQMRRVLDDEGGEHQRELLLAAQELKRAVSTLFYLVSPDATASPAAPVDEASQEAPSGKGRTLAVPALSIPSSGLPSLASSPGSSRDDLISAADELLQDLGAATPLQQFVAASDRGWVKMPPLDDKKLAEWSPGVPAGAPPAHGVRALCVCAGFFVSMCVSTLLAQFVIAGSW